MLKPLIDVLNGLDTKYEGTIKEIRGYSYIPWNDTVDQANAIFGHMGWSSEVRSIDKIETAGGVGIMALVRVTVTAEDEITHQIAQSYHDGVGYGDIQTTKDGKDLIDTAVKAAESDALSRAFKKYGDAFGLYLYDKENAPAQASNGGTYSASAAGGALGKRPTEGQANGLYKLGLTDADIAKIPFTTWKAMLDTLWAKDVPMSQRTVPIVQAQFAEALAAVGVTFGKQGGLLARAS